MTIKWALIISHIRKSVISSYVYIYVRVPYESLYCLDLMGEIILLMCNLQLGRKTLKIIWKPAIKIEGGGVKKNSRDEIKD